MIVQEWHCWIAEGEGPTRYIISEGSSREEAVQGWEHHYGQQYAAEQVATHLQIKGNPDGRHM